MILFFLEFQISLTMFIENISYTACTLQEVCDSM